MPYSVNDPKLPSNVKKLSDKQKRRWVQIWNSTYQSCVKGGADAKSCESKAFRVANGVLKKGKRMRLADRLKAVFRPPDEAPCEECESAAREPQAEQIVQLNTRSMLQRVEGKHRLFSISAVSAINRVGEIDSRSLFDSMASIARATGRYPRRDLMHWGMWNDAFVTGDVVFMARDGNCLVTVTEYNDSELAQAEIKARAERPDVWGDSIAYVLLDDPEVMRQGEQEEDNTLVLNFGFCKYVSTVPEKIAASHFTRGSLEVADMQAQDLEILATLFGDEDKARSWLEKHVGDVERAIEDAGLMTRAVDEEPEPEAVEIEPEVVELEVDDDLLAALADRASELLEAKLAAFEEGLNGLMGRLDQMQSGLNDQVAAIERRIAGLERTDDEIVEEVRRDMPRKARTVATYRPRGQSNGRDDDEQPTYADQADEVLSSLRTSYPE